MYNPLKETAGKVPHSPAITHPTRPFNRRMPPMSSSAPLPLNGTRILSLALNLPGPAALMRCARMGATCTKLEPLAPAPQTSGSEQRESQGAPARQQGQRPRQSICPCARRVQNGFCHQVRRTCTPQANRSSQSAC